MRLISRLKRAPKFALGLVLYIVILKLPWLKEYWDDLLSTWLRPDQRGRLDKIVWPYFFRLWQSFEFYGEKDPDVREARLKLAMGGDAGVWWAKFHEATPMEVLFEERRGDLSYWEQIPVFEGVEAILSEHSRGENCCVIQPCSSGGRMIDWVASKFPKARCVGIDNVSEVVEYAAKAHHRPNLEFILLSAQDMGTIIDPLTYRKHVVFSDGALQYVQPEHLAFLFKSLGATPGVEVLLCWPIWDQAYFRDVDWSKHAGRQLSYTHDYRRYAEHEGFVTVEHRLLSGLEPKYYYWRGVSGQSV